MIVVDGGGGHGAESGAKKRVVGVVDESVLIQARATNKHMHARTHTCTHTHTPRVGIEGRRGHPSTSIKAHFGRCYRCQRLHPHESDAGKAVYDEVHWHDSRYFITVDQFFSMKTKPVTIRASYWAENGPVNASGGSSRTFVDDGGSSYSRRRGGKYKRCSHAY